MGYLRRLLSNINRGKKGDFIASSTENRLSHAVIAISKKKELPEIVQSAVEEIKVLLGVEACWMALYQPDDINKIFLSEGDRSTGGIDWNSEAVRLNDWSTHQLIESKDGFLLIIPFEISDWAKVFVGAYRDSEKQAFTEQEIQTAEAMVSFTSTTLDRTRLMLTSNQRTADLEAIYQAGLSLTSSLDLEQVLSRILENTLKLTRDALDAHIFLYDGEKAIFGAALLADGTQGKVYQEVRENGLTYTVAKSGEFVVISDVNTHPMYKNANFEGWAGSIIGIPLKSKNEVVGVMNVAFDAPRSFTSDDLKVYRLLGDQAALAIANASMHDLVSKQALTDALTGVPNRRALNKKIEELIQQAKHNKQAFSLVIFDLNKFKKVNDRFGHLVGDQTLATLGECLQKGLRKGDFLARYGGDEFALLLPHADAGEADKVVNRLRKRLSECKFEWPDPDFNFILSFAEGVSSFPEDAETAEALLKDADTKMYGRKD